MGGERCRWASWRLSARFSVLYLSAPFFSLWLRCLRHGLCGGVPCAASAARADGDGGSFLVFVISLSFLKHDS